MPSAASVVNHAEARKRTREANMIPGPRSLHRGIHVNQNGRSVAQWKANPHAKRADPKELMVHHQKIDTELKDLFARTAALHKDNMTMEERIEESWKAFERIGGKRPKKVVGFREHLDNLREGKATERKRAEEEYLSRGEATDYSKGSALHNAKDRRVQEFVQKQLKRAHTLRRVGDPTPLKQSGTFDRNTNTLKVFQKTIRQVRRGVKHDERIASVKEWKGKGSRRSVWDLRDGGDNINSSAAPAVVRSQDALDFTPRRHQKRRRTG